ncbi:MAG: DUF933 domain-containing protein [Thermodesulfobacteriota bacterium]
MKAGIIGLPRSGKTTVLEALTRSAPGAARKGEPRLGVIKVPDARLETLFQMYKPPRAVFAQFECFLPGLPPGAKTDAEKSVWNQARDCDALIQVVRNFGGYGFEDPNPESDLAQLEQELVLADLVVVDKRLDRLRREKKVGKPVDEEELALLEEAYAHLEAGKPLRQFAHIAGSVKLRSFALLSAKPRLILFNNPDEDDRPPEVGRILDEENFLVIRGKLEQELAQMSEEEAADFLAEFDIPASATNRVVAGSYELLGLISFFTTGDDEVRAWTIKKGTAALDAAGAVHTDMKKGFIRAEVVAFQDLMAAGSMAEARKRGTVRLEGKTYEVQDGDIITFRFNV